MPASNEFSRYVLRTTDAAAARTFYATILEDDRTPIVPLHEQALARGARPHWLGQIEVDDVEVSADAFLRLGAERLGPTAAFPDGRKIAVLRDPGGAVVGLTSPGPADEAPLPVVWHQLDTTDLARAMRAYTTAFGWRATERVTHPEHGEFQHFTWANGGPDVGAMTAIAGRSGRYPQWLFRIRVVDLDRAIAVVRAASGVVFGQFLLPSGERIAVCDDPQGAGFAMVQAK